MRKVAIAFLLRSSRSHSSVVDTGPACFSTFRHLATGPSNSAFQDAVVVALSETSMGASQVRKALEKKKATRPKKNKSGCSEQDLRGAERPFVHAEISTVKDKKRPRATIIGDAYAEDSASVVASKKATSSPSVVATEKTTELTEIRVVEAENTTVCENAAVEKREELASCSIQSANMGSLQEDLTEIMARLDLSTYKHGDRWADAARKLLAHGIAPTHVMNTLKRCRTLPCSQLWVDSRVKQLAVLGLSHQEMGRIITRWPTILNVTDSMFQRKIEFYKSIGVDQHCLGKIIKGSVIAITKPLSVLRKNAAFWNEYLKEVHVNAVGSMVLNDSRILTYTSFEQKLAWLEAQDIKKKGLLKISSILSFSLPLLMSKAKVLEQFGILDGRKRVRVFVVVVHTQICKLQARYDNLLAVGFSRNQVQDIICRVPSVLTCTEDYVNLKVNYVLHIMNTPLDTLASSSAVWSHNLERRIKSRHEVIKRLQSLGALHCNLSLDNMIRMKTVDFNRRFVEKLQDFMKQAETRSA